MPDKSLLPLGAEIISAYVSNNAISADDLSQLFTAVYDSLANLSQIPEASTLPRNPAVPIGDSSKSDGIVCLECGKSFKTIKRHLLTKHQLTPSEYRECWRLPGHYPLIARNCLESSADSVIKEANI
jgi:predicted transcriptional regulator